MAARFQYLFERGHLQTDNVLKESKTLYEMALRGKNMFMKFQTSDSNNVMQRLHDLYQELFDKEKTLYEKVINELV